MSVRRNKGGNDRKEARTRQKINETRTNQENKRERATDG